jgi:hypothetical protein
MLLCSLLFLFPPAVILLDHLRQRYVSLSHPSLPLSLQPSSSPADATQCCRPSLTDCRSLDARLHTIPPANQRPTASPPRTLTVVSPGETNHQHRSRGPAAGSSSIYLPIPPGINPRTNSGQPTVTTDAQSTQYNSEQRPCRQQPRGILLLLLPPPPSPICAHRGAPSAHLRAKTTSIRRPAIDSLAPLNSLYPPLPIFRPPLHSPVPQSSSLLPACCSAWPCTPTRLSPFRLPLLAATKQISEIGL